jgi:plasmid replication initiation protein
MAAQISPHHEDFKPVRLNISEFTELLELEEENYIYIQQVTRKLLEKVMTIRQGSSKLQISWISSAEYFYGYVDLCFDPKLKPYLLQLKERFTKYPLQNIIRFRHSYSIRLYELLKQYESIGSRYFGLDAFRSILGIQPEEYKLYGDIKRYILEPVRIEFDERYRLNDIEFTFEYKEIKEVRKVVGIRFEIKKPNQLLLEFQEKAETSKTDIDAEKLVDELLVMKLTKRQANSKVKKYPAERILRNIELTKQKNAKGEVNNLPAFLLDAIDNDYAKDCQPVNPKLAELRKKAKKCWNNCNGNCAGTWTTYKGNQSSACHFCAKFEKQRKGI